MLFSVISRGSICGTAWGDNARSADKVSKIIGPSQYHGAVGNRDRESLPTPLGQHSSCLPCPYHQRHCDQNDGTGLKRQSASNRTGNRQANSAAQKQATSARNLQDMGTSTR